MAASVPAMEFFVNMNMPRVLLKSDFHLPKKTFDLLQ